MISRRFLHTIIKKRYFENGQARAPATKINQESFQENLIEEDERERLGSWIQVPYDWKDFLNPLENMPLDVSELKFIA